MTTIDPAAIMNPVRGYLPDTLVYRLAEALAASEAKVAAVRRMAEAPHVYVLSTDDVLDALNTCKHGRPTCFNSRCVALAEGEKP